MNRLWTDAERARVREEIIRAPYAELQDIGARLAADLDRPPKGVAIMAGRIRAEMRQDAPEAATAHAIPDHADKAPTMAPRAPDEEAIARIVRAVLAEVHTPPYTPTPAAPVPVPAAPTRIARDAPTHGRFIFATDLHYPYHDEATWQALLDFARDFKPDRFIVGGDWLDLQQLSKYDRCRKLALAELPTVLDDFRAYRKLFREPLRKAVGDNCYIEDMEGNHEVRIRVLADEDPAARDYDYESHMADMYDGYIPLGSEGAPNIVRMGKLWFTHGWKYTEHHAKAMIIAYNRPLRYGHVHDVQQYALISATDVDDFRIARSVGCLCNRNPHYRRYQPNRWTHSFCYGYVEPDGDFWDEVPIVNKGRVIIAGNAYPKAA